LEWQVVRLLGKADAVANAHDGRRRPGAADVCRGGDPGKPRPGGSKRTPAFAALRDLSPKSCCEPKG